MKHGQRGRTRRRHGGRLRSDKDKVAKRLIRRLEELGLTVDVKAAS
jgi:hypothetical protein